MPVVRIRGRATKTGHATPQALASIAVVVAEAVDVPVERVRCTFEQLSESTVGEHPADPDVLYVDFLLKPRAPELEKAAFEQTMRAVAMSFQVPLRELWGRKVSLPPETVFSRGEVS